MIHRSTAAPVFIVPLALAVVSAAALATPPGSSRPAAEAAAAGSRTDGSPKGTRKPLDLTLKDLDGNRRSLSELRGRVVLLNFWASWCGPCRREMPDLAVLQREMAAAGVQVIGASTDDAEDEGDVRKFVQDHHLTFPVWLGATTDTMTAFGLPGVLPSTVILDREGFIAERFAGTVPARVLKAKIETILKGPARAVLTEPQAPGDGASPTPPGGSPSARGPASGRRS